MTPNPPSAASWRLSVAPLMDWTDRHCRYFHRLPARRTRLYTEMVTPGRLLHGDVPRHLDFNEEEHPVALQRGSSEAHELSACARLAEHCDATRSTSTADARANGCSAARSAPA